MLRLGPLAWLVATDPAPEDGNGWENLIVEQEQYIIESALARQSSTAVKHFIEEFHRAAHSEGGTSVEAQRAAASILMDMLTTAKESPPKRRAENIGKALGLTLDKDIGRDHRTLLMALDVYVGRYGSISAAIERLSMDHPELIGDIPEKTLRNWYAPIKRANEEFEKALERVRTEFPPRPD